jgi:transcriptional regulator with XRE-family HTH domain
MTSDSLGVIIRQARLKARLSQSDLARNVGTADGTIWRAESPEDPYIPSKTVVRLLALTLKLDVNELLRLREVALAERHEAESLKRESEAHGVAAS